MQGQEFENEKGTVNRARSGQLRPARSLRASTKNLLHLNALSDTNHEPPQPREPPMPTIPAFTIPSQSSQSVTLPASVNPNDARPRLLLVRPRELEEANLPSPTRRSLRKHKSQPLPSEVPPDSIPEALAAPAIFPVPVGMGKSSHDNQSAHSSVDVPQSATEIPPDHLLAVPNLGRQTSDDRTFPRGFSSELEDIRGRVFQPRFSALSNDFGSERTGPQSSSRNDPQNSMRRVLLRPPPTSIMGHSPRRAAASRRNLLNDNDDEFSRKKWSRQSLDVFLDTVDKVDRVCHGLVQTSRKFSICPTEMRELSLTVAVVERALNGYALKLWKHRRRMRSERRSGWPWRHPGGVVSLLQILTRTLRDTEECLFHCGNVASFKEFVWESKSMWALSVLVLVYTIAIPIYGPIEKFLFYTSNGVLAILRRFDKRLSSRLVEFSHLLSHPLRLLPTPLRLKITNFIVRVVARFRKSLSKIQHATVIEKISTWINRIRVFILPLILYGLHQIVLRYHLSNLSRQKEKLNNIILHWQLCMTAMRTKNRLDRSNSDWRREHSSSNNMQRANRPRGIDIYRWMLESVPPPADSAQCFWYGSNFRLNLLKRMMDVAYASMSYYHSMFGARTSFAPLVIPSICYYSIFLNRAAIRANEFLANPDYAIIRMFFSFLDSSLARLVVLHVLPTLKLANKLETYAEIRIRATDEDDEDDDAGNPPTDYSGESETDSSSQPLAGPNPQSDNSVRLLLFSARKMDLAVTSAHVLRVDSRLDSNVKPRQQTEQGLIFFLHGGGWMANFCASDLRFLGQWSQMTNALVVEVDYSVTPARYPTALDECFQSYKFVCQGGLGFNFHRIAVVGDSSGANLAVAMTLKVIKKGLRPPDTLILCSPILNLRADPTPSRLMFMMDPLIPMNLIALCRKMYLPAAADDEGDCFISPLIAAPDHLLSRFPHTSIIVGGLDPFLDDAIDFAHRLCNVGVTVQLRLYKSCPHAFLGFNYVLPDVNHAIHLVSEWINDTFRRS